MCQRYNGYMWHDPVSRRMTHMCSGSRLGACAVPFEDLWTPLPPAAGGDRGLYEHRDDGGCVRSACAL